MFVFFFKFYIWPSRVSSKIIHLIFDVVRGENLVVKYRSNSLILLGNLMFVKQEYLPRQTFILRTSISAGQLSADSSLTPETLFFK